MECAPDLPVNTAEEHRSPARLYEPTEREQAAVEANRKRGRRSAPSPRIKVLGDSPATASVTTDHPSEAVGSALMLESFGTTSPEFAQRLIAEIISIESLGRDGSINESVSNGTLALARAVKPRDEVEAMLGVQMAAIHVATMNQAHLLSRAGTHERRTDHEKAMNRLARTFATQLEALKRYRSKGEQRVYVERVNVNEGGQAIVGSVERGEG